MNVAFLEGKLIVGAFYIYNGLNHFIKLSQMTDYAKFKGVSVPKLVLLESALMFLAIPKPRSLSLGERGK